MSVITGQAGLSAIGAAAIGGAVGSAASQGVAIAIGEQEEFDWGAVGMSAIGAGVTAGLGASETWAKVLGYSDKFSVSGVVDAATSSVLTQGLGIVTGLQDHFSWKNVAASAIAAPVASSAGKATARYGALASQASAGITGSLVRAAIGGKVDAQSVLIDAFGNALGNSIVDSMTPAPTTNRLVQDGGTTREQTFAWDASGGSSGPLSGNAANSAGAALTPDKRRQADTLQEIEITAQRLAPDGSPILGGVMVTAPRWNEEQGRVYDRLAPYYGEYSAARMIDRNYDLARSRAELTESAVGRFVVNNHVAMATALGNPLEIPVAAGKWLVRSGVETLEMLVRGEMYQQMSYARVGGATDSAALLQQSIDTFELPKPQYSNPAQHSVGTLLDTGSMVAGAYGLARVAGAMRLGDMMSSRMNSVVSELNAVSREGINPALAERLASYKAWKADAGIVGVPSRSEFELFPSAVRVDSPGFLQYSRNEWPPNMGFRAVVDDYLDVGYQLDRFGYGGGKFASPLGEPYRGRALRPGSDALPYNKYEVVVPMPVQYGPARSWFGYEGGSPQILLPETIDSLLSKGWIRKR